jgi:putative tryptophan/tyrosine transport system substrate-binding protein
MHGLRDLGWIEGRNVVIERRALEGNPQRAPAMFAELLARGVDVMALGGARWLHDAALKANPTVPMVTIFQDDPVASGLIASLARPGGILTGIAQTTGPEFNSKRLQLLKELDPRIARIALVGPRAVLEQDRGIAHPTGVAVLPIGLDADDQLDEVFANILRARADALMVVGSAITYGSGQRIVAFASENRLPAMYAFREAVDAGGLMSYGSNVPDNFRQMARLAGNILKGAKPADLPVEQPIKFEFLINAKTAKALGIAIPHMVLALANEVIE